MSPWYSEDLPRAIWTSASCAGVIRSLRPSLLQPKWGSGEASSNDPQPGKQETIPTARILRASLEIRFRPNVFAFPTMTIHDE